MSDLFLLDTDIVSDLVRRPGGPAAQAVARVGESRVRTSVIVAAELRYGATKKGSPRLSRQLEQILEVLPVLPLEAPTDRFYGMLRARLERAGELIGSNDLLIAAHALALDCVLVTDNEREFVQVPNLRMENWLKAT